jgi:hypothetical protein
VPKLLGHGLRRMKPASLAMGLDLTVPPLALLLTMAMGLAMWDLLVGLIWQWWLPLAVSVGLLALYAMAIGKAWWQFGEGTLTGKELLMAPWMALRKIPLYLGYLTKGQTSWTRAKRDDETH